jgi:hypothetical protein
VERFLPRFTGFGRPPGIVHPPGSVRTSTTSPPPVRQRADAPWGVPAGGMPAGCHEMIQS